MNSVKSGASFAAEEDDIEIGGIRSLSPFDRYYSD
jgi:hypothetical protein